MIGLVGVIAVEVYTEDERVVEALAPKPLDCSFELSTIVDTIGVRAKSYCYSTINKYLFSYGSSWLTVCPRRAGTYAVLGRLFPREHFKVQKSTIDYDYFFQGSKMDCVNSFAGLVSECLRFNFELC